VATTPNLHITIALTSIMPTDFVSIDPTSVSPNPSPGDVVINPDSVTLASIIPTNPVVIDPNPGDVAPNPAGVVLIRNFS
jgi:hypothetical protein